MKELGEAELKVFVDAVIKYFSLTTREEASIRSAYLAEGVPQTLPYVGLITLSGHYRGCVHFSTTAAMMRELLVCWGENDTREANMLDGIGEVANTIAGNARRHFGPQLEISVPIALRGMSEHIKAAVRTRPFVIAVTWRHHEAMVVVDLAPVE
jgi:chemotaxis protein CheX